MQEENSNETHAGGFTPDDIRKAGAIVRVFETSRAEGDYSAVAVLNDGAGISYGAYQLTHRSGSLAAAIERYLAGGKPPDATATQSRATLTAALPLLKDRSALSVRRMASSTRLKSALRLAGSEPAMREAQDAVVFEWYMRPALRICGEREFTQPLSLAVVYDSVIHGSWARIAARANASGEKAWVTEYVRRRHAWLTSIARLRPTSYRTKFFLDQIVVGNWELRLPLNVRGVWIRDVRARRAVAASQDEITDEGIDKGAEEVRASPVLENAGAAFDAAAGHFDKAESVVAAITARSDRAKSLWTTVAGTVSQGAWAIVGFAAGVPRYVWVVTAVFAGLFMLLYLYRQIELGKIRERNIHTLTQI